jgi:primosomal protein N' (replication factor Y) (superfamily II helicase)
MIKLVVKHKKPEHVNRMAGQLAEMLRKNKSLIVLGPEFPLVSRIQLWYHKESGSKSAGNYRPTR